jgi:6-phosphogluconate dehydrogenase
MELGMIGLGRMGGAMAQRLIRGGHRVVGLARKPDALRQLEEMNIVPAASFDELVNSLKPPRIIWLMIPAGAPVDENIAGLLPLLETDDVIVDGGNSNYKDTQRRAEKLKASRIHYVDAGTSGGVWGLQNGYSIMVGGDEEVVARLRPIFETLAPAADKGWGRVGPNGAGHFTKMVHNGIEYGMMQAFAEGFDIMRHRASEKLPADERYDLNLADVAEVWRRGSVVTSWLLDLTASALAKNEQLEGFSGHVEDSGEGRWTIEAAIEEAVPADVLAASLFVRFRSRQQHTFAEKVLSAMRLGFGGHVEAAKK